VVTRTVGLALLTANVWVTDDAVLQAELPTWLATMLQVPALVSVTCEPETRQALPVVAVNVTGSPDVAVALTVNGLVPKVRLVMLAKLIVWLAV
jgi:hypothetical protein